MSFCLQPISSRPGAAEACFCPAEDPVGGMLAEAPAAYRPRHPERIGFYQLFETHFDSYVRAYEERFEARSGPLRPVVVRSVEAFLDCGRLQGGFARIRCPKCRDEHLLAFSCRTRNFCSSCQAKRSVLFAEKLVTEVLAPVPHRHWTFSIPRVLRGLFERDRKLLGLLSQTAYADFSRETRSTWARLLRKIFEVDPLVCQCGARMQIVSFITEPRVVDRILRHRESERCKTKDPFEPRAPPHAGPRSRQ